MLNWLLILNADNSIQSTSWKLTPYACLIRSRIINDIGLFNTGYNSIEYAFLDYGYKCIQLGIIIRYDPSLLLHNNYIKKIKTIHNDEKYYVKNNFSYKWQMWVIIRTYLHNLFNYNSVFSIPSDKKYNMASIPR